MTARRPPPPIPVTILTGFLGSGKTTLLNRLLAAPELADTLVLINEFGEIGLDHLLIEKIDGDMLLMASGCLCCTIRGDLVNMLEALLRRLDNNRIKPFRRLAIETTGLADPTPILHAVMGHPYFALRYRLDGVVATVDAVNGLATLERHKEAVRQVAVADRLVLTKMDLLPSPDAPAFIALQSKLDALNPAAPRFDSRENIVPATLLSSGLFSPDRKIPDVAAWLRTESFARADDRHHDHDRKHAHEHRHDRNRHDSSIAAFCLTRDTPLPPQAFQLFLDLVRHAHGPKLLRMKGIVALADDPSRPVVVHGVQHLFHPAVRLDAWPDADHRTRIVFILDGLDRAFVDGLLAAALNEPRLDAPDSRAMQENPLELPKGGLLSDF